MFPQEDKLASASRIAWMAAILLATGVVLLWALVWLWPSTPIVAATCPKVCPYPTETTTYALWFLKSFDVFSLSYEAQLFAVVILSGMLGSFVVAATSFVHHVGNRNFIVSWTVWLILRAPVGGALAVALFVILQGFGLATFWPPSESLPAYVVAYKHAAIGAFAGMFWRQVMDKLEELLSVILKSSVLRANGNAGIAPPKITKVEPKDMVALTDDAAVFKVTVEGERIDKDTRVFVGDKELPKEQVKPEPENKKVIVSLKRSEAGEAGKSLKLVLADAQGNKSSAETIQVK